MSVFQWEENIKANMSQFLCLYLQKWSLMFLLAGSEPLDAWEALSVSDCRTGTSCGRSLNVQHFTQKRLWSTAYHSVTNASLEKVKMEEVHNFHPHVQNSKPIKMTAI